jgi:NADH:ubiquinone oxidoreductase subunit 6 (subunit J)
MVFLIVYIGAIAVLFLFVIYMLNLKIIELNEMNLQYLIGIVISFFFLIIILYYSFFYDSCFKENLFFVDTSNNLEYINFYNIFNNNNNIGIISILLYNNNYIYFFLVSLILLVAMIGVIVLTSHKTFFLKEQIIFEQIKRFIKK